MPNPKTEILLRALDRERSARKQAEAILEEKALELYQLNEQLKSSNNALTNLNKQQTSKLNGVFDSLVDAYILMDIKGNIIEMNTAAKNLFGYDVSDAINVTNLIYKDDFKYAMESFKGLILKGYFKNYNARVYTKIKQIKRVHINASLVYDSSGKPIAAQGIVRDITAETKRQEIFENQKQQLSIIIENSPVGIALTQKGVFLEFNKAFQQLLGYSSEELKSKTIKDISFEEDFPASAAYLEQLNKGLIDQFTVQKRYICKDKSVVWAKTSVGAVRDKKKQVQFQVAIIEDITEEYKEAQLKKQLLSDLEKSNDELNDFAHVISHDLKSPLRSMNTLIYWLKEDYNDILDLNAKDILNKLTLKVGKMDALISGVLEYSSIDKVKQRQENVNIQQLVKDIIKVIYIPTHIQIHIPELLPTIFGDQFRLQQLFQNLLNNAVSYIDKNEGLVTVTYSETATHWQFQIADNGIGIDEKYQNKIFEVFQSLEKSEHSTGIGLSIVKKIIAYYKGKIWLISKVGKGTTFYFTIKKEFMKNK